MKTRVLSGFFWGIMLIIIGTVLILNHYVSIELPLLRILFGFLLIYWGMNMVFGKFSKKDKCTYILSPNANMSINEHDREYSIVLGNGTIDLTDSMILRHKKKVIVNSVFADVIVLLPDDVSVNILANTAFGEIRTPGRVSSFMSKHTDYVNPGLEDEHVSLISTAVFGNMTIKKNNRNKEAE